MASLEPGREGTCLARLAASTSSTARSPAGGDRAARVEREQGVRACGVRASGHGRAMRWRGRCAHSRQLGMESAQVGRVIGAPVSRRRQGRGAAHRRRLGRARVPSGVAAAGHVWGHRSALEVFALHLSPDAMAQPVINEAEVERGRRRVLGWAQGGCGAGHTIGGSTFRRAGSQGGERRGGLRQEECRVGTINALSGWVPEGGTPPPISPPLRDYPTALDNTLKPSHTRVCARCHRWAPIHAAQKLRNSAPEG